MVRSKPSSTAVVPAGISEGHVAEPDLARGHSLRRCGFLAAALRPDAIASRKRSTAVAGAAAPSTAHDNPPNAIMLVPTAALAKVTANPSAKRPSGGVPGDRPEHQQVGREHQQQAPQYRPFAQSGRVPLQIEQLPAPRREPFDRPRRESEQPQLLGGRRIDRQTIRVIGVPLRVANFVRCCDRTRPRFRAAANASRTRPPPAAAAPTRHKPPAPAPTRVRRPVSTIPEAMKSIEIDSGGPLMPRSKSRAMVRSVVRRGSSRCPIPGGATQALVSSS